ncbi:ABC transporter substrate-binding protein [Lachnospiraceae bacterium OttesenSCG-928-D06]|nr:ABC transporter substrate-binding protein [Lachnospiraceae bacterium OttesenSCG-928-D06]
MKKKLLATVLSAILTLSLAACGNSNTTSGNTDGNAGGSSSEVQQSSKEDIYTVTMVLHGSQQPDEERIESKVNEILEKELNAHLDIVVLPWASAVQSRQLMLAGDEKIDIFYSGASDSIRYMHSGQIMDMADLIDQYGTNLKEIFGEEVLSSISVNGFVYGVPNQIERGSIPAIFMRKDLVDKYHIDVDSIHEPKDMEAIFEIVKAGEPDMLMLYSSNSDDTPLSRLFGGDHLSDSIGVLMDQENSALVENYYATDWYRETTAMLHDWYNKGYISKDAGTDKENWRTVFKAGNMFSLFYAYHPGTPVEFESSTGYEFEIVTFRDYPIMNAPSYTNVIFSIAQNSENPEKAMEVLDYIYGSPEIMNLLNWGEEGVDYVFEDQENGVITFPEGITADNVGYSLNLGWELPNQFIAHKWIGSDPKLWENMESFNNSAQKSKAVGFNFDSTPYENELAALNNVVKQYVGTLDSGAADPEVYLPQFLQALEDADIDKIIAAKQEQLDQWLAQ